MKKFIISIIAGAILIGIGAGVLFFEVAQFSVQDYLPYIKDSKISTFTFSDEEIFENNDNQPITIDVYLGRYFEQNGKINVIENPNVKGIEIEVNYRGTKPRFNFWSYRGQSGNDYGFDCRTETLMPKEVLEIAKYICKNKVFVEDVSNYYIEEFTVKTSNADLVNIVK